MFKGGVSWETWSLERQTRLRLISVQTLASSPFKHSLVLTRQKAIRKNGLRSEAQRSGEKKVLHVAVAALCESKVGRSVDRRFKGWEEKPDNVCPECKKTSGSSTRYQRCDSSVFSKDHIDEHYTAKYPLIDIKPISQIAVPEARDLAEPVFLINCQLNGKVWRIMQATAEFLEMS